MKVLIRCINLLKYLKMEMYNAIKKGGREKTYLSIEKKFISAGLNGFSIVIVFNWLHMRLIWWQLHEVEEFQ